MNTAQEILQGFLTTEGRLQAALILFMVLWSMKNIHWLRKTFLTSDRSKLLTALVLAFIPAGVTMASPSTPASEAWYTFIAAALGAMGLQGGAKAALGGTLKGKLGLGDKKLAPPEKQKNEKGS
jgi:hypothetical protein